jgi:antitoxin VapB
LPLYVKDAEVDRLAARLAALRHASKTDVVREALLHELERVEGVPFLVIRTLSMDYTANPDVHRRVARPSLGRSVPEMTSCVVIGMPDVDCRQEALPRATGL